MKVIRLLTLALFCIAAMVSCKTKVESVRVVIDFNGGESNGQEVVILQGLPGEFMDFQMPIRDEHFLEGFEPALPATFPKQNTTYTAKWVNGIRIFVGLNDTLDMVLVKGGTMTLGATAEERADSFELNGKWFMATEIYSRKDTVQAEIKDFYISQTEVTQKLWNTVMAMAYQTGIGALQPQMLVGDMLPAHMVRYYDLVSDNYGFFKMLNGLTPNRPGKLFRLPTENEWEYAARGGQKSKGYMFAGSDDLDKVAWYGLNTGNYIQPVKSKAPNELGLYDMSGNVCEFCIDKLNPKEEDDAKVLYIMKGGGVGDADPATIHLSARPGIGGGNTTLVNGFRIVLEI